MTRGIQLSDDRADRLCWKWTADKTFSTASAYQAFFIGQHPVEGARLLRKARAPPKCKFFIWLVLHDRCWTAARRRRHGLQDDDSCALCEQSQETIDHLLINCPFSRELWFNFASWVGSPFLPLLTSLGWPLGGPLLEKVFIKRTGGASTRW